MKTLLILILSAIASQAGTVICFHGNGDGGQWRNSKSEAGQFVADLRGHGYSVIIADSRNRSWCATNSKNNPDIRATLAEVARQGAEPPFYLVGHSNGGGMASRFAVYSGLEITAVQYSNASGIRGILASDAYSVPSLFCYSAKDRVVSQADILDAARLLISRGLTAELEDVTANQKSGRKSDHAFRNTSAATIEFFTRAGMFVEKGIAPGLLQYSETHTAMYRRKGWKRLLSSLAPWAEVGADRAQVRIDSEAATVSGAIEDNSQPSRLDLIPHSLAVGITGGVQFWDFCSL
jgi:pimeloyl-ACP methyl ester carboxylesterase